MPNKLQEQGAGNYTRLFNQLGSEIENLSDYVARDVEFSDPFVQLHGIDALSTYLAGFSARVIDPHFEPVYLGWDGDTCLLRWNFSGGLKTRGDWCFAGVSELHFDGEGRVTKHVDHWDSGRYFYRRLPLLGLLIRQVERRL